MKPLRPRPKGFFCGDHCICNYDVVARKRAYELTENLIRREHSSRKLRKDVSRALDVLLLKIFSGESRARINIRIPLLTTYHPEYYQISQVFHVNTRTSFNNLRN